MNAVHEEQAVTPDVSIITTTYNHRRYIGACIESVLAQNFGAWEQIVLDDGSTDGTGEVVRAFEDPRIRYIRQDRLGIEALAHTYNRALEACRAPVIAILEGDDLWPADKLARQLPRFLSGDTVLSFGEVDEIDAEGIIAKSNSRTAENRLKMSRDILYNDPIGSTARHLLTLDGQSFIQPASVLLRRDSLKKIGGFQYIPGICPPDVPTFIQLALLGKFSYSQEILGYRRRHLTSSTMQFLQPMATTPREYALRCAKRPEFGLSAEEQSAIEKTWQARSQTREFDAGRICLLQRQWQQARSHFLQAIRPESPRAAAGAVVGWLLSWAHLDLEGVFRLAGRAALRPQEND